MAVGERNIGMIGRNRSLLKSKIADSEYPFTKDTFSGLFAWWDFSDLSTITKSGNNVTAVTNKQGITNRDLANYLTAYPQYVESSQNSLSGIRVGTSATVVLGTAQFTGGTEVNNNASTIIAVINPNNWTSAAGEQSLWCGWVGGANITQMCTKNNLATTAQLYNYNTGYTVTGITNSVPQIIIAQYNGSSSKFTVNSATYQTGTTEATGVCYAMTLGAYNRNINLWTCDETLYEFIWFNKIASDYEIGYVRNYLREKWNLY